MPEAVASNSIPAPDFQHMLNGDFDAFDETIHQLEALAAMTESYLEDHIGNSRFSFGIGSLYRQVITSLQETHNALFEGVEKLKAEINWQDCRQAVSEAERIAYPSEDELYDLISAKLLAYAVNAHEDAGQAVDERRAKSLARELTRKIMVKMQAETDMLEAGSLLPWAEFVIRDAISAPGAVAERDRRVGQGLLAGLSALDISIHEKLARGDVERIVGRLTQSHDDTITDEVREKIERASDAP